MCLYIYIYICIGKCEIEREREREREREKESNQTGSMTSWITYMVPSFVNMTLLRPVVAMVHAIPT